MSGGAFDYAQYRISEIYSEIEDEIYGHELEDEWKNDFKSFYDWSLRNGWQDGRSIDRIDNNKGYSPDNCRYTDRITQARNTRSNIEVVYKGKKGIVSHSFVTI